MNIAGVSSGAQIGSTAVGIGFLRMIRHLNTIFRLATLGGLSLALAACASTPRGTLENGSESVVFHRVSVVPMKGDTILENMTVVVRNDRIVAVEPANRVRIPVGAQVNRRAKPVAHARAG